MRSADLIKQLAELHPNADVRIDTPQGTFRIADVERTDTRWAWLVSECTPESNETHHDICKSPCPRGELQDRTFRET